MTECNVVGMANEKDHSPGCRHQEECVSCKRYLLKHSTRFPLGPDKMALCFFCFRSKWQEITRHLDIDWKAEVKNWEAH